MSVPSEPPVAAATNKYVPWNELVRYVESCLDAETEALGKMLVPREKAAEDTTGDAFDVFECRARIATLRKIGARVRRIVKEYV